MTISIDIQHFTTALNSATNTQQAFSALYQLSDSLVGARLFTVMCVDMNVMLASRAYSSNDKEYPVSGTKPVEMNSWFDIIHTQSRTFVANTLKDISVVFPDHELIGSLGCGSVVNLPIIFAGELVATINLLHEEHYFSAERVCIIEEQLQLPGLAAWLVHDRFVSRRQAKPGLFVNNPA